MATGNGMAAVPLSLVSQSLDAEAQGEAEACAVSRGSCVPEMDKWGSNCKEAERNSTHPDCCLPKQR
jgi:hypothetical protein